MEINVCSKAIEKSLDLAKEFLGKLISPSVEEAGLLFKDKIAHWRLNNQINVLLKVKAKCEENHIDIQKLKLKLLCPLLENISLEDDEFLQDKWSNLISNLIDSKKNLQNNIFPEILSKISKDEFQKLESSYSKKHYELPVWEKQLDLIDYKIKFDTRAEIVASTDVEESVKIELACKLADLNKSKIEFEIKIKSLTQISKPIFEAYEISNLIRLGVLKSNFRSQNIPHNPSLGGLNQSETFEYITFTDLGELLLGICMENKASN
jgi:hypothetical protein